MRRSQFVFRGVVFASLLVGFVGFATPRAQAAYTNTFDALRAELVTRSAALSNSTDRTEVKQKKVLDRAIKAIDKPAKSLANDLNTTVKIYKALMKAFPGEFSITAAVKSPAHGRPAGVAPTLSSLLEDVFSNIESYIQDALDQLITAVNALPAGRAKDRALIAVAAAQQALTDASSATQFKDFVKALGKAFKAIVKGQKIVAKAGGGGGGTGSCGTITTSSVTMTASNDAFNATSTPPGFAGGEYTQSTKTFSVGGTDGVTGNGVAFTVDSGVTGAGTYTNVSGNYTVGSPPTQTFNITSGSMTINGLDLNATTACGTGSFTASDGTHVIVVTNFTFAIKTLGVSP